LHRRIGDTGAQYRLFALSELSYTYAQVSGDRSYYLAAAVYAYALLFPGDAESPPLGVTDPRIRVACDLYNRALAEGLKSKSGSNLEITAGPRILPFGVLDVTLEPDGLTWAGYSLEQLVPAADLVVRGLRIAIAGQESARRWSPARAGRSRASRRESARPDLRRPITAFLRPDHRANLSHGWPPELELYSQDDAVVDVDGREWPLEAETSPRRVHAR
jgi:hypothetical protein